MMLMRHAVHFNISTSPDANDHSTLGRLLLLNSPEKMAEQIMLDKASRKNRAARCRKVKTAN
jgi:hypothetical protein